MKRFFTPLAILLCFLASSCMREESLLVPSKWREARMKSLVINASHGQDTKTVVPDAGTTVLWDADETIKVFGVEGDAAFKSTNTEPAATTQFGGSLKYSNGDKIFGLYPWSEDAQRVNDTIITNVPYFQLGRANSFAKDMNISIAESSTLDMHFFNVCGGVRFTLDRDDIYRIILESAAGEPLAGDVKIFFEDGLPKVKSVSDTCSRVILNTDGDLPFESGKWYYVEFIPGEITQGFKISFYSTDGQKGTATLSKPVTIRRGIFLSKESIDNNVTFWETIEDESPAIRETDLEVEIPVEAEASYISKLKLSNYYGEYSFNSMAYSTGKRRSYGPEPTNSTNVYGVNYKYAGDGLMFQFLLNDKDDVVMSCIIAPDADNTMSAESTAIQLLMTTPELITDNIEDFNATVAALRQLDAFYTYVRQVRDEMNAAVKEGKSPNYASIDQNPVFNALISMFKQTTDSWQGLDLLDIERDTDLRTIMLKVRNHYHRVVHIYSRRVWMTDNNMGELRSEDAGFKLSEVMKAIAQAGTKQMSSLSADFGNFEIDEDYVDMALDIMSEMDFSKMDIIPFPYFLEPENAGYLETVIGTWYWKETSTPFEATTDDLTFKMKDADKLFIDVYGLGKYDSFSTLSNQEQLQIVAVILHSVYKDFVVPIIKLAAGVKNMDDALDGFHYDLRYGARAAPLQAFFIKLLSNFSPSDMAELATNLENHDYGMAFEQILIFVVDQVFQNPDEGDMATYHNLLYNTFKKYIWKPLSGSAATSLAFRTGLKSVWNKLSVAHAAATLSVAVLNVAGSAAAVYTSDGKTTFILDMEPDPYVTLLSPLPDAVIKQDKIELSWDMHMGNRVGNIAYDVRFFQKNATNVSEKTFRELVSKSLTVNLTDLPLDQSDETVSFQIIAHKPNAPDMIYARSEVTPIHIAAFRKPITAIDLGLPSGVKWGSMNLGATLPEEPGDYYAWGETEPVGDRPYEWGDSSKGGIIKYNTDSTKGVLDGLTQLELADDAASAQLKGYWRMPTAADFAELQEYCDLTWTTRNGVKGLQVTSKTNSNYVFMPAVGYYGDGSDYVRGTGWYWSSTLDADRPDFARYVQLYGGGINASSFLRPEGLSIRPVYDEAIHVTSVSLDKTELELNEGQTDTLVVTVLPADAANKAVTWSSSNEQVATVSSSGEVTALAAGSAIITVTTADGAKTATCAVTVTEDFDPTVCPPNQIWYTTSDGLVLTPHKSSAFEANIVSNNYENGKGVITFDKNIQAVGKYAFSQCNSLMSITIPEGVISIGKEAFYGCGNLISVSIPTTVTSIDEWAFYECSSLSAISFPDGISNIGNEAFWGCNSLTSITIPGCVTTIGARLFMGCTGLETVTIMEGVTTVGNAMFAGCGSLTSVTLPEGLLSIGSYAFSECGSLATITIPETVSSIGHGAFEQSGFTLFTIPEGVTSISDYTFRGCSNLSSITISGPLTDIGRRAFLDCSSLTSINIPESVTSIGEAAFEGCSSLGSITLPGNVSVGNWSFSDCSNLNTVTFLAGLTTIGSSAFTGCRALNTVTFFGSVMSIGEFAFYECGNLTTFTIMEDISDVGGEHRIEREAFGNTGLTSFRIPEGITGIGDDVFCGCSSLTSITIPGSVTSMGSSVFSSCEGLESVIIKDGVTQIGSSAFYNCSSLSSITIPGSVTSIGYYAFASCLRLAYVSIPESVACIEACTFKNCSSLSSITIPGSVTSIEYEAFAESGLTSITIPGNVKNIGEGVFSSCSSLESVTISDGVTSIGKDAFSGSGLTSITIPGSVTSIGAGAFSGSALTSITIPGSVTNIEQSVLSYCSSLKSVTISDGVTSIGYGAFQNCGSLTSVSIPSSVTSIESAAFFRCYSLSSVTIPTKVTSIESYTFFYCRSLVSISIHDGIRSIGEQAFYECSNLTRVNLYAGTPPIGASGMFDYTNECPIYVPGASVGAYKAAEYWSNYADRIKGL